MPFVANKVLPFLLGFLTFIKIGLIGSVSANELVLAAALPFYTNTILKLMRDKRLRRVLILGLLYLLSLIASDLYRGSMAEDYLRGWTRVAFTLTAMVSLMAILAGRGTITWLLFLVGWFLSPFGGVLAYGVQTELYKFYLAGSISGFSFIGLGYLPAILSPIGFTLPIIATALAFLNDSRSAGGVTLLAFLLVSLRALGGRLESWSARKLALVAVILILGAVGIIKFYGYAASNGYFGVDAYDKYMSQVSPGDSTLVSIIFGGRVEIYFTWPKIAESPFIGYGSWPKDWVYTHGRAAELNIPSLGAILGSRSNVDAGLIPSHSHIFGAWLEAGVFGAIFWAYALWLTIRVLISGRVTQVGKLWPVFTYVLISFAWDMLFSPFGGERRVWNGFVLAWILSLTMEGRDQSVDSRKSLRPNTGFRPRREFRPYVR